MYCVPKYYRSYRPTVFSFINAQIENHLEVVQKFINNMAANVTLRSATVDIHCLLYTSDAADE